MAVWLPDRFFREALQCPCEKGELRESEWSSTARAVQTLDGDYYWLICKRYSCSRCDKRFRGTAEEVLAKMPVRNRACLKVYFGQRLSVDNGLAEYIYAHFGVQSLEEICADLNRRTHEKYYRHHLDYLMSLHRNAYKPEAETGTIEKFCKKQSLEEHAAELRREDERRAKAAAAASAAAAAQPRAT